MKTYSAHIFLCLLLAHGAGNTSHAATNLLQPQQEYSSLRTYWPIIGIGAVATAGMFSYLAYKKSQRNNIKYTEQDYKHTAENKEAELANLKHGRTPGLHKSRTGEGSLGKIYREYYEKNTQQNYHEPICGDDKQDQHKKNIQRSATPASKQNECSNESHICPKRSHDDAEAKHDMQALTTVAYCEEALPRRFPEVIGTIIKEYAVAPLNRQASFVPVFQECYDCGEISAYERANAEKQTCTAKDGTILLPRTKDSDEKITLYYSGQADYPFSIANTEIVYSPQHAALLIATSSKDPEKRKAMYPDYWWCDVTKALRTLKEDKIRYLILATLLPQLAWNSKTIGYTVRTNLTKRGLFELVQPIL